MSMKIGETVKYKDTILECVKGSNCKCCYFNNKECREDFPCTRESREDKTSVIYKEVECEIGKVFNYKNTKLKCVEQIGCEGCFFKKENACLKPEALHCSSMVREDDKSIIFKEIKMDKEVDEVFDFEGTKLKCVKSNGCTGCFFDTGAYRTGNCRAGYCSISDRNDCNSVIFKKLEEEEIKERKLGEEFTYNGTKLKCVKEGYPTNCNGCFFQGICASTKSSSKRGECEESLRTDLTGIKFVAVQKEPDNSKSNVERGLVVTNVSNIVEIPENIEVDTENSNDTIIRFKKKEQKIKTFQDLIDNKEDFPEESCYINSSYSDIDSCEVDEFSEDDKNVFIDKTHAKSALAMSQISQLMPYYGGAITKEEWDNDNLVKYVLDRRQNGVNIDIAYSFFEFLAFHTAEQRDAFYENNAKLVKEYLMIEN